MGGELVLFRGRDVATVTDVLVTWIGAIALARFVIVFGSAPSRSTLDRRARFLVGALSAMLFVRGFSWLAPESTTLAFITFLPVAALPVGMTLFSEGLLRRHVPHWMKWLATIATAVALLANVARVLWRDPPTPTYAGGVTLAALFVPLAALALLLARRDQSSLSGVENALVRTCGLVAIVALPLLVTDFRLATGWPMVRLGTLGALVFCYTLTRQPQENVQPGRWLRDAGRLLGKAVLVVAVVAAALGTTRADVMVPLSVVAAAGAFVFAIWDRLRDVDAWTTEAELLEWLSRESPRSMDQVRAELRDLPLTADATLLAEAELSPYDHDAIVRAFSAGGIVQTHAHLRALQERDAGTARGADELIDILARHEATHVGLLSSTPLTLLVVAVPAIGNRQDLELALGAVVRRCQHAVGVNDVRVV